MVELKNLFKTLGREGDSDYLINNPSRSRIKAVVGESSGEYVAGKGWRTREPVEAAELGLQEPNEVLHLGWLSTTEHAAERLGREAVEGP